METKYLVISAWSDKTTGTPMISIAKIGSGINKNGLPYEIADTDKRENIEGTYPVGTILKATTSFAAQEYPEAQRGLKLGTSK